MLKRWTPQRFLILRRVRVLCCAAALVLASALLFSVTQRKAVALSVNGETRQIVTYADSVARCLEEQHIAVKTHDVVTSTSQGALRNHDAISVQSAYQVTVTIDGQSIPFWTVATSARQLLDFFRQNNQRAQRISIDVHNLYNRLTGGVAMNRRGPVTIIADGKAHVAPDGTLPASSLLDAQGIVLGRYDQLRLESQGDAVILRVIRVRHETRTLSVAIPYETRVITDPTLAAGMRAVRQQGVNGMQSQTYADVYSDGQLTEHRLLSASVISAPTPRIEAVGTAAPSAAPAPNAAGAMGSAGSTGSVGSARSAGPASGKAHAAHAASGSPAASPAPRQPAQQPAPASPGAPGKQAGSSTPAAGVQTSGAAGSMSGSPQATAGARGSTAGSANGSATGNSAATGAANGAARSAAPGSPAAGSAAPAPKPIAPPASSTPSTPATPPAPAMPPAPPAPAPPIASLEGRLIHPTPEQAKLYASGAAAQRGWTGQQWEDLVKLWNRESSWRWNAENPSSHAYGIPQSLPGSKMASVGANWHDDAAIQIDWGLNYIAQRYGNPSNAWAHSQKTGWY